MKPSPDRPLARLMAVAFLALVFAASADTQRLASAASLQSANTNQSAASPANPTTGRTAQSPTGGDAAASAQPRSSASSAANPTPDTPKTNTPPPPPPTTPPTIISASNAAKSEPSTPDPKKEDAYYKVALGEQLKVVVSDRKALVGEPADLSKITLLLNSYPMNGIPVYLGTEQNVVLFDLVSPDNAKSTLTNDSDKKKLNETWNALLSGTGGFPPLPREITVSIMDKNGIPLSSDDKHKGENQIKLQVVNNTRFWVFVIVLAFAIALFFYFARKSNLIRDPGPEPQDKDGNRLIINGRPALKSYSLARAQFAFWAFIIIGAYAFIWMVTTNQNTLNNFTLGIFGISAATAVGATLMDKSKRTAAETSIATLQQSDAQAAPPALPPPAGAGGAIAVAPAPPAGAGGVAPALAVTQPTANANQIAALDAATRPGASKGFWTDVLSDDTGVTIHRFQIVAWTLVLGIIFISTVSKTLTMPDFDNTLLALMGISSGTYIGLKPTESQSGASST
jgi:hypothetical protein